MDVWVSFADLLHHVNHVNHVAFGHLVFRLLPVGCSTQRADFLECH